MNRDIQFRAQTITGDQSWVYGNAIIQIAGKAYLFEETNSCASVVEDCDPESSYYLVDGLVMVDVTTIGQYIGLKDKKGRKMFEGDIITFDNVHFHVIEYNQDECSFNCVSYGIQRAEIVGNIYKNHNLIYEYKETKV